MLSAVLGDWRPHSENQVSCADGKGHSRLRNGRYIDGEGGELEDLLTAPPPNVPNATSRHNRSVSGITRVDVTLAGDAIDVTKWKQLDAPSLSDHCYITLDIIDNPPVQSLNYSGIIYRLARARTVTEQMITR